jgi:predicted house-cleaning noncanonical NTP pyrophosphatase (MazG superfamily)
MVRGSEEILEFIDSKYSDELRNYQFHSESVEAKKKLFHFTCIALYKIQTIKKKGQGTVQTAFSQTR